MIDFVLILKFTMIFIVGLISPGPDFVMITSLALSRGRWAGILGAAGITLGALTYVTLCLFGLGFIIARLSWLSLTIKIVGGLYLIYLGYQLWKSSLAKKTVESAGAAAVKKTRNPFLMGLATNLTNPKAMAFFSSIFALLLTPDINLPTEGGVLLVTALLPLLWFGFVSVILSTPAVRKVYMRAGKWIDRVGGTFLALFGLRLLWSAKN